MKRKYWQTTLAITTIALLITMAVSLTACGETTNAATASRTTDTATKRASEVIKSIETIEDTQFKFPAAFDEEFSQVNEIMMRRRYYGRNNRHQYSAYIEKLDDLYLKCADIQEKNMQVTKKIEEIKKLMDETRSLRKQMHTRRKNLDNPRSVYLDIESKCVTMRGNFERLYVDRGTVSKELRSLPNTNSGINIEISSKRYNRILEKLSIRLELLEVVKEDIQALNVKLCQALGHYCEPEDSQVTMTTGSPTLRRLPLFGNV